MVVKCKLFVNENGYADRLDLNVFLQDVEFVSAQATAVLVPEEGMSRYLYIFYQEKKACGVKSPPPEHESTGWGKE